MARVIEIVVLFNALGGAAGWGLRRYLRRRRETHVEHVRELEQENVEMDRMLERMRNKR
jgi:membrane protein YqaA with SNARE-associated domain